MSSEREGTKPCHEFINNPTTAWGETERGRVTKWETAPVQGEANKTKIALAVREAMAAHRAGRPLAFPMAPPRGANR